jgi:hypothetical protein
MILPPLPRAIIDLATACIMNSVPPTLMENSRS